MSEIRRKYLGNASVTIVLIGSCTHSRRYVDWEIKLSRLTNAKMIRADPTAHTTNRCDEWSPEDRGLEEIEGRNSNRECLLLDVSVDPVLVGSAEPIMNQHAVVFLPCGTASVVGSKHDQQIGPSVAEDRTSTRQSRDGYDRFQSSARGVPLRFDDPSDRAVVGPIAAGKTPMLITI
jgi:hypothetical protein